VTIGELLRELAERTLLSTSSGRRAFRLGRSVLLLGPLIYAGPVFAVFVLPWIFLPAPHGFTFYALTAQVLPVLLLVDAFELRFFAIKRGAFAAVPRPANVDPDFWTERVQRETAWALETWIPITPLAFGLAGEGASLYASAYRENSSLLFALCVGGLLILTAVMFIGATGVQVAQLPAVEDA